jgi:hypothetical protein
VSLVYDVGFSLDIEARPDLIVAMLDASEGPAVHAWR